MHPYLRASVLFPLFDMLCRNGPTLLTNLGLIRTSSHLLVAERRVHSSYAHTVVGQRAGSKDNTDHTLLNKDALATGLERLPAKNILRSLVLGSLFTTPYLFKPGYALLRRIANSRSPLLNPDTNPLLFGFIKPLVYDAFCAGRNQREIYKTRDTIKQMGFSGVILCYGRENVVDTSNKLKQRGSQASNEDADIHRWREGNLDTLDMIGEGDWLGVKYDLKWFNVQRHR